MKDVFPVLIFKKRKKKKENKKLKQTILKNSCSENEGEGRKNNQSS